MEPILAVQPLPAVSQLAATIEAWDGECNCGRSEPVPECRLGGIAPIKFLDHPLALTVGPKQGMPFRHPIQQAKPPKPFRA
jgi:hypothetical protein